MWNQCCFITPILKSLVIVAVWLALIGAIYLRIAHLTINLQESEIYFDNFTNDLQTSPTNDSLWRLSHSYVDMDEVRQTSNLIVTTTSLSTQDEIWSQIFLLFLRDSTPKPKTQMLITKNKQFHVFIFNLRPFLIVLLLRLVFVKKKLSENLCLAH